MAWETSDLVKRIEESKTIELDEKAKTLRAEGRSIINFAAAEPDVNTPALIIEAAARAAREGHTKYTQVAGLPVLRRALSAYLSAIYSSKITEEEILVSNGGKQALFHIFQSLLNAGDEVLIIPPYWGSFTEMVKMVGGHPVVVDASATPEAIERAITSKTRMLILNNPNNPSGRVYPREWLADVLGRIEPHPIWLVSDDVYSPLVYAPAKWESIVALSPSFRNRTLMVGSASKAFAMTGWRIGWAVAPSEIIRAMAKLQGQVNTNVCTLSQMGLLAAITDGQSATESIRERLRGKRDLMVKELSIIRGLKWPQPDGAFYLYLDLRPYLGGKSDLEFCQDLLVGEGISLIPGTAFGTPGFARLAYTLPDDELKEGAVRLKRALERSA